MSELRKALEAFANERKFIGKGPLCVALVVTQHAKKQGLPLNADKLVTDGGGQVLGLGKSSVQAILKRHNIERVLASEGGRTSRGSLGNMREYVSFLNSFAENSNLALEAVEAFWIERVHQFFAAKPFKIRLDASKSLRAVVQNVISQAEDRQKKASGTYYVGGVLQHFVGAKLDCAMGQGLIAHNSFSTSDQQTGRAGDFLIGDVAIHVTATPTEGVIQRCRDNLDDGFKPVIVTLGQGVTVAEALGANAGIANRIDVFDAEQFIALNLYEIGKFELAGRRTAITDLIRRYNDIVDEFETDPSLKIELKN